MSLATRDADNSLQIEVDDKCNLIVADGACLSPTSDVVDEFPV